jgi:hypothetical protein
MRCVCRFVVGVDYRSAERRLDLDRSSTPGRRYEEARGSGRRTPTSGSPITAEPSWSQPGRSDSSDFHNAMKSLQDAASRSSFAWWIRSFLTILKTL